MYIDALLEFSAAQAVTATALSTNTVDLQPASAKGITVPRQIGDGEPMAVQIAIVVAANFASSDETYQFQLVQSAAAALTTPIVIAQETFIATGVMISSLLVAGFLIVLPIPPGLPTSRYIGLNYVTGGTGPTMTVTAWLTKQSLAMATPVIYPKGYTIK